MDAAVLAIALSVTSALRFTWDPAKARSNLVKHGISFDEASTVFGDPNAQFYADLIHPERYIAIGCSQVAQA